MCIRVCTLAIFDISTLESTDLLRVHFCTGVPSGVLPRVCIAHLFLKTLFSSAFTSCTGLYKMYTGGGFTPLIFNILTPRITILFRVHFYTSGHPWVMSPMYITYTFLKTLISSVLTIYVRIQKCTYGCAYRYFST